MKVKAIINFNDLKDNISRKIGDIFECSEERAKYLLDHNAIEIEPYEAKMADIDKVEVKVIEKPKKKKSSKK